MNKINTPIEFMIELDWDEDALRCAIKFLNVWDRKSDDFYINHKKINKYFDQTEREHYRNCVNFWRERLKYEN